MRTHAEIGESILRRIAGLSTPHRPSVTTTSGSTAPATPTAWRATTSRWRRGSWPRADTYSAITVDRVYRAAAPPHEAIAELRACAGVQLDPTVVDAAISVLVAAPDRAA